jgi:hypothetical protein
MKELPLAISFSGGKTSGFMARYLQERFPNREKCFIISNTGMEKEASLVFANECDKQWGLSLVWVEADIEIGRDNQTSVVTFDSANRNGAPFAAMIKKYGLPNKSFPHCTRELKERPIKRYLKKVLGWTKYETAIGIRFDERHRISEARRKDGFIYPLSDDLRLTNQIVNAWWEKQSFNLHLKDYEGNCDFCWKKSRRKRLTLLAQGLKVDLWKLWESQSEYTFDRDGYTIQELEMMAQSDFHKVRDKHEIEKMNPKLFNNMDFEMECFCKSSF